MNDNFFSTIQFSEAKSAVYLLGYKIDDDTLPLNDKECSSGSKSSCLVLFHLKVKQIRRQNQGLHLKIKVKIMPRI